MTTAEVVRAIADIIEETAREAGPLGAPSGHIYAALSATGLSLDTYQVILGVMERTGRIRVSGHVITALGTR